MRLSMLYNLFCLIPNRRYMGYAISAINLIKFDEAVAKSLSDDFRWVGQDRDELDRVGGWLNTGLFWLQLHLT